MTSLAVTPILQTRLPFAPWMDPRTARLPGVIPADPQDWLRLDEAFAPQMAERDRLLAEQGERVAAMLPQAREAAEELLERVLSVLIDSPGYQVAAGQVVRPDGVRVQLDRAAPMPTLCRLVQEDLCLMQKAGGEHVLTAAALCFPASWTLAEKLGRPLLAIHAPVPPYSDDVARRVQRLFDGVREGQPLQRMNALVYDDATLFQPRLEGQRRPRPVDRLYLRSERQCLTRLAGSGAVVFSIHTYVVRLDDLEPAARAGLDVAGL
jgi:dimethylamine monooxygenase subunit A